MGRDVFGGPGDPRELAAAGGLQQGLQRGHVVVFGMCFGGLVLDECIQQHLGPGRSWQHKE